MWPSISIIVPVLNEEAEIAGLLEHLMALRPHEVIIADGGSTDATLSRASRARVVEGASGRGPQLNAGAAAACGDVLLFLHADVRLAPTALKEIQRAMLEYGVAGGNLDIIYLGGWEAGLFTRINRLRRRFHVFYGDSGIFCRREVFERLGGYRDWPLLEDYEFARRLSRAGRLALLESPIQVSARRWQRGGLFTTLWSWFWIQALYLAGVSPHKLASMYRHVR
ncbi:MAG: glycosyltransferase [Acidimicrobiia bacterium]|nr:glycosyltransferase [Acidimicrobiia bacterium]